MADRRELLALAGTLAVATTVFVALPRSTERAEGEPELPTNRLPDELHAGASAGRAGAPRAGRPPSRTARGS